MGLFGYFLAVCGAETAVAALGDAGDDDFACGGDRAFTRFAYVMMHYEGTAKDPEYVLGTRVLIKSLLSSGTKQDLVVLASTSVSQKTLNTFCNDGAIVQVRSLRFECCPESPPLCPPTDR